MYHYLFTNDLRISVLDESLKKAGQCFTTDTVPPSSVDKSANNNMMTLGFYFTLNENSNCAKAAAAGNRANPPTGRPAFWRARLWRRAGSPCRPPRRAGNTSRPF